MDILNRVDSVCEDITSELHLLGECVQEQLPHFGWQFEEIEYLENKIPIINEKSLMLDKKYFPNDDATNSKESWYKVAAGASAYTYKSIGVKYAEPVRKWLANAANIVVQFGLLAQCFTTRNNWFPEGDWFLGTWTVKNTASAEELRNVIDPSIFNACLKVIFAAVLNFLQFNCYAPKQMSNYAVHLLNSEVMDKYGVSKVEEKMLIMNITGRWVSRIRILQLVQKTLNTSWKLKDVKPLGYINLKISRRIEDYFDIIPPNWRYTRIAVCIAHRLVRSNCVYFADFSTQLIEIRKQLQDVIKDPLNHHCDHKYLLKSNEMEDDNHHVDDNKKHELFGRLITFLKYAEPNSNLFQYKRFKSHGKTNESQYPDYDAKWEAIVKIVLSYPTLTPLQEITDKLKELKLIPFDFNIDKKLIQSLFAAYKINKSIQ